MERYFPDFIKTLLKEILLFSCSFFTFINYYCDIRNRTDRWSQNALFIACTFLYFVKKNLLFLCFLFIMYFVRGEWKWEWFNNQQHRDHINYHSDGARLICSKEKRLICARGYPNNTSMSLAFIIFINVSIFCLFKILFRYHQARSQDWFLWGCGNPQKWTFWTQKVDFFEPHPPLPSYKNPIFGPLCG